ncbi:sporulation and spore germination related protein [Babesia caballi]|uniref:Sporulation and spore germination related protein n=1 Tax=Babesia caballi TaxID=5871 RepID=A0AAV4LS08_BABCB|nr:sporulation and spore germination related protein [Babesia caballi]
MAQGNNQLVQHLPDEADVGHNGELVNFEFGAHFCHLFDEVPQVDALATQLEFVQRVSDIHGPVGPPLVQVVQHGRQQRELV